MKQFLKANQVKQRYRWGETTLWRRINEPNSDFPKPVKMNGIRYWDADQLDKFDAEQQARTDEAVDHPGEQQTTVADEHRA